MLTQNGCQTICSSQPPGSYPSHSTISEKCVLKTGTKYKLHCKDTYTDGWNGGYITIQGVRYCDDFCPTSHYCYGQGQWDPLSNTGGGELYVVRNIMVMTGNNLGKRLFIFYRILEMFNINQLDMKSK